MKKKNKIKKIKYSHWFFYSTNQSSASVVQGATKISKYKSENENKEEQLGYADIYTKFNHKPAIFFCAFKTCSKLSLFLLPLLELCLGLSPRKF